MDFGHSMRAFEYTTYFGGAEIHVATESPADRNWHALLLHDCEETKQKNVGKRNQAPYPS